MSLTEVKREIEELGLRPRVKPLSCSSGVIVTIGGQEFRKHYGYRYLNPETDRWMWGVTPSFTPVRSREEQYEEARPK